MPENEPSAFSVRLVVVGLALLLAPTLSSCVYRHHEWRSVFLPPLTKTTVPITITQGDGTTRPSRVTYYHTESRSGDSAWDAIELKCFNCISGYHAEEHILKTRFEKTPWTKPTVRRERGRIFHIFPRSDSSRSTWIWIDATDYHDLF
jgi:hypothetical protein